MKCSDITDKQVLDFLADRQGKWTSLWMGYFESEEYKKRINDPTDLHYNPNAEKVEDVFFAFLNGTPEKVMRAKMRKLWARKLVGGCPCGCRGDFEITDKGLALIGRERTEPYSGY